MLVDLQEDCLRDIPCILWVPQHAQCSVVDRSFVSLQEDLESCPIPVATPLHQLGITHVNHKYRRRREKLVGAGASTRQMPSSIWKIRSNPEYRNMSRMCRFA